MQPLSQQQQQLLQQLNQKNQQQSNAGNAYLQCLGIERSSELTVSQFGWEVMEERDEPKIGALEWRCPNCEGLQYTKNDRFSLDVQKIIKHWDAACGPTCFPSCSSKESDGATRTLLLQQALQGQAPQTQPQQAQAHVFGSWARIWSLMQFAIFQMLLRKGKKRNKPNCQQISIVIVMATTEAQLPNLLTGRMLDPTASLPTKAKRKAKRAEAMGIALSWLSKRGMFSLFGWATG